MIESGWINLGQTRWAEGWAERAYLPPSFLDLALLSAHLAKNCFSSAMSCSSDMPPCLATANYGLKHPRTVSQNKRFLLSVVGVEYCVLVKRKVTKTRLILFWEWKDFTINVSTCIAHIIKLFVFLKMCAIRSTWEILSPFSTSSVPVKRLTATSPHLPLTICQSLLPGMSHEQMYR